MPSILLFMQSMKIGAGSLQVLDLGSTEEVASWDEGNIHFQEISTQPDYTR